MSPSRQALIKSDCAQERRRKKEKRPAFSRERGGLVCRQLWEGHLHRSRVAPRGGGARRGGRGMASRSARGGCWSPRSRELSFTWPQRGSPVEWKVRAGTCFGVQRKHFAADASFIGGSSGDSFSASGAGCWKSRWAVLRAAGCWVPWCPKCGLWSGPKAGESFATATVSNRLPVAVPASRGFQSASGLTLDSSRTVNLLMAAPGRPSPLWYPRFLWIRCSWRALWGKWF